tara:strand:+ start:501 stop:788 length:288 start_codon:yes stop_codon:yes gene_type:complete
MDAVQFHIALAIYYEFQDDSVEGFEYWRCAAGVVHFVGVHDGSVLEASVYMDEESYLVFCEHIEDDVEDEEDESSEEEDESSDEEYEPRKRQRRE